MIETKTDCYHYLDLNKISKWIINTKDDGFNFTSDEGVDNTGEYKKLGETKTTNMNGVTTRSAIIMDMLKVLYDSGIKVNQDNSVEYDANEDEFTLGTKMVLNTFEMNGFMVNKQL